MKKQDRVKSNVLFNEVIKKGTKVSNSLYTSFFSENKDGKTLFGVSAPKKVGNAVTRNRCKRQIRALIDNNKNAFKKGRNYIIIIKERFLSEDYINKDKELKNLIGEINAK